ncbi:TonB family protein [Marinobacter xestospongiae]|uniref:TonB family protein n=1 Tax=Marinobacter xestospongiae TaxID=994319 RepID=A0ABU3VSV6_9GAMM|nr:TonB family protein [Marinobacter xestospongiae]MDV2077355.1 TonB family protein [Marinobacter xestospongiae]
MSDTASHTVLPANYRIGLAVSIALLLHTLVATLVPPVTTPTIPELRTLQVTLTATPQPATPALEPAQETPATPELAPAPTRPRDTAAGTAPSRPATVVTTRAASSSAAPPQSEQTQTSDSNPKDTSSPTPPTQPQRQPATSTRSPRSAPSASQSRASAPATPSQPSTASPTATPEESEATITQLGDVTHKSPYEAALARRISEHSRQYLQVRTDRLMVVELELNLLDNGALMAANIAQSSGNDLADRAAYRGALNASPYPAPPSGNQQGNRFRVKIVFTPERL